MSLKPTISPFRLLKCRLKQSSWTHWCGVHISQLPLTVALALIALRHLNRLENRQARFRLGAVFPYQRCIIDTASRLAIIAKEKSLFLHGRDTSPAAKMFRHLIRAQ